MLPFLAPILGLIDKFIPDQSERDKAKSEITRELTKQMEIQADIIKREQQSDSWLTRNWRPLAMVMCGVIIGTHWLLYDVIPYFIVVFDWDVFYPQDPGLSPELWTTLRLGLGGYIGGRTVEKVVKLIKA